MSRTNGELVLQVEGLRKSFGDNPVHRLKKRVK